jgi:hypothetical protein
MATKSGTASSKEQILKAFHQVLERQKTLESKIVTKEELAERAKDREVVQRAGGYTIETIVKGLAELQLVFGTSVETLARRLGEDSGKLEELQRAIAVETERTQHLVELRTAADALNILKQEYRDDLRAFEDDVRTRTEALDGDTAQARAAWAEEARAHAAAAKKYEDRQKAERKKAEDDYSYELARKHKVEVDAFDEKRRVRLRELGAEDTKRTAQWNEREAALAAQKAEFEGHKAKVDAFPHELEESVKKAREDGIREASGDAKVRAELMEKEVEANRKVAALQIQSLESTLARQAEQIDALTAQLQNAVTQTQGLAHKAIEGTARKHETPA